MDTPLNSQSSGIQRDRDILAGFAYLFPMLEATHVVSLALVFGTIAAIDFRLLGWLASPVQLPSADSLKRTWVAFASTTLPAC